MNGKIVAAALTSLSLLSFTAQAIPTAGETSGQYYLLESLDLSSWHAGLYGRSHERTMKKDGAEVDMDVTHIAPYVGYDVFPWFTLYGVVGYCSLDVSDSLIGDDSAMEWGLGAMINILDHDAMDFNELCDRFRIQSAIQYTLTSNDIADYGELSANVTFGIVNEVRGSKEFWAEAIALYVGPSVNVANCDEYDQKGGGVGLVGGLDIQISPRVSLGGSVEVYDDDQAFGGTVSVRF